MKPSYIVSVFECNREYGGPEEGGWWYDTGVLVKTIRVFHNEDEAISFSNRMQRLLDKTLNKDRHDIGSVLCEGWYTSLIYENASPRSFPLVRPHYE